MLLAKDHYKQAFEAAINSIEGWRYQDHLALDAPMPNARTRDLDRKTMFFCHDNGSVVRWTSNRVHTDMEILYKEAHPSYPYRALFIHRWHKPLEPFHWRARLHLQKLWSLDNPYDPDVMKQWKTPGADLQAILDHAAFRLLEHVPEATGSWVVSTTGHIYGHIAGAQRRIPLHAPDYLKSLNITSWIGSIINRKGFLSENPYGSLLLFLPTTAHERLIFQTRLDAPHKGLSCKIP